MDGDGSRSLRFIGLVGMVVATLLACIGAWVFYTRGELVKFASRLALGIGLLLMFVMLFYGARIKRIGLLDMYSCIPVSRRATAVSMIVISLGVLLVATGIALLVMFALSGSMKGLVELTAMIVTGLALFIAGTRYLAKHCKPIQ